MPETGNANLDESRADLDRTLRETMIDVLGVDRQVADGLGPDSGLFGSLPELDSMAVATLLTELEDRFSIVIDDEDVDAQMLETYGGLVSFLELKLVTD